ncbi:hypothetical protein F4824DRAFT_464686 [Ustulina deusta]|nr:hypothetical protein F4824DRAFT_464686 [Ustulina deusta]
MSVVFPPISMIPSLFSLVTIFMYPLSDPLIPSHHSHVVHQVRGCRVSSQCYWLPILILSGVIRPAMCFFFPCFLT